MRCLMPHSVGLWFVLRSAYPMPKPSEKGREGYRVTNDSPHSSRWTSDQRLPREFRWRRIQEKLAGTGASNSRLFARVRPAWAADARPEGLDLAPGPSPRPDLAGTGRFARQLFGNEIGSQFVPSGSIAHRGRRSWLSTKLTSLAAQPFEQARRSDMAGVTPDAVAAPFDHTAIRCQISRRAWRQPVAIHEHESRLFREPIEARRLGIGSPSTAAHCAHEPACPPLTPSGQLFLQQLRRSAKQVFASRARPGCGVAKPCSPHARLSW